jgi:hypothetical protein
MGMAVRTTTGLSLFFVRTGCGFHDDSHALLSMWLLAIVLVELILLYYCVTNYVTVLFLFLYLLWYMDGSEHRGNRSWEAFRSLSLWKRLTPITHIASSTFHSDTTPRLYVVLPSDTYVALFWGFGLHGGNMQGRLLYVVPPIYMWIPVLRDVLLWSGAITYGKKMSLTLLLQTALQKDTSSVAFYASLTSDSFVPVAEDMTDAMETQTQAISDDMLDFVLQRNVSLCAVVVCKEHERYWIPRIKGGLQRAAWTRFRHPFPLVCCYRGYFARTPPPAVIVQFGPMLTNAAAMYGTRAELKQAFETIVHGLCVADLHDNVLKMN